MRVARVVLAGGSQPETWVDITVDGDVDRAQALCQHAIVEQLRIRTVKPDVHVAQACGARPLQPIRARSGGVLLVQRMTLDSDADLLTRAFAGHVADDGGTASGHVTVFTRHADKESCERSLATLRAAHLDEEQSAAASAREFLDGELAKARAREAEACAAPSSPCAPGVEGEACRIASAIAERACTKERQFVVMLQERQREAGPAADLPVLQCVTE